MQKPKASTLGLPPDLAHDMPLSAGHLALGELVGGMITKSPGKPALAAESDKRPAYNGAAADFSEVKAI